MLLITDHSFVYCVKFSSWFCIYCVIWSSKQGLVLPTGGRLSITSPVWQGMMLEPSRLRDFSVASQSIGTELQCWPLFSPPDRVHFPLHNTTTKSIQTQHPNKISAGQKKSHTHVLEYQATCQTNAVLLEGKGLALLYFCHCAVKDNSAGLGCANLENPKERSDPCPAPYREPLSPQNFLLVKSILVYLRPWPLQMVYDNSVIYGGGLRPYGITLTSGGLETE